MKKSTSIVLGLLLIPLLGMANSHAAETLDARIDAALNALNKDALVKLAMDLCDIPSPTGYEEDVARMFQQRMSQERLVTNLQPIATGRANVLGVYEGSGGGQTLMFIGHLDTWWWRDKNRYGGDKNGPPDLSTPPPAKIVDGKWISGTGMWNMKGALAAYLAAVKAVRTAGISLSGDVIIAGVAGSMQHVPVDEFQGPAFRGYAVGAQEMLVRGGVADMCVMGEPTQLQIVTQNFGHTQVKISIGCHARSKGGFDAVESAAEVVRVLEAWIPDYQRRKTVAGVTPAVNFAAIKGGNPWRSWRSPEAVVYVHVETPPKELPIAVKHEIRQALAELRESRPEIKATVELYATNPGAAVPEDSPVVRAVREAHTHIFGTEPRLAVVPWHSDAGHLNRYGVPTVNYGISRRTGSEGPSKPLSDYFHVDDLVDLARVYIDLIVRVCGAPPSATG